MAEASSRNRVRIGLLHEQRTEQRRDAWRERIRDPNRRMIRAALRRLMKSNANPGAVVLMEDTPAETVASSYWKRAGCKEY
jgi:hypothetical protein